MKQKGLFDEEYRLRVLRKLGDTFEKLNEKIKQKTVAIIKMIAT